MDLLFYKNCKNYPLTKTFLLRHTFQTTVYTVWRERNTRRYGEQPQHANCSSNLWTREPGLDCYQLKERATSILRKD